MPDAVLTKPIPGMQDYWATADGRIVSTKQRNIMVRKPVIWRPHKRKLSYWRINAIVDGKHKTIFVHDIVALTFHGPRQPKQQVRHLDGDSSNNSPYNLAWGSAVDNEADKTRHGTRKAADRHPLACFTAAQIHEIRHLLEIGTQPTQIARMFNVKPNRIHDIKHRRTYASI